MFDDDGFILGSSSLESSGVGFAGTFDEDGLAGADEGGITGDGDTIDGVEEIVVTSFLFAKAYLIRHFGSGSAAARGVLENESVVELHALDRLFGEQVILLRFSREANNDVCRDGEIRAGVAHGIAEGEVLGLLIGAAHELKNTVTTALHGEVDMAAEFGKVGEGAHEILAKTDGVWGGEPDTFETVNFVHGFQKAYKGAASVDGGLIFTVTINDLSEKGYFLNPVGNKFTNLSDDVGGGTGAFHSSGRRNNAVGAAHLAALHDRDESRAGGAHRKVVADEVVRLFIRLYFADVCSAAKGDNGRVFQTTAQERIAKRENAVEAVCAGNDIETWNLAEKLLAAALTHAPHEAEDNPGTAHRGSAKQPHLAKCLELGFLTHRARVDEYNVGMLGIIYEFVAACEEHGSDLLGVAFIHLAAVGFDVGTGHGCMESGGNVRELGGRVNSRIRHSG